MNEVHDQVPFGRKKIPSQFLKSNFMKSDPDLQVPVEAQTGQNVEVDLYNPDLHLHLGADWCPEQRQNSQTT